MIDERVVITRNTDHALVLRHAPVLRLDRKDPFLPSRVGYTIFEQSGRSKTFPREIYLPDNIHKVIEYAIWWDWDIGHLYELEHIWIYLDHDDRRVYAEASFHGDFAAIVDAPVEDNRIVVYSEPGKHAFAESKLDLYMQAKSIQWACTKRAGVMGVHVTSIFDGIIKERTFLNSYLVYRYLKEHRFDPTFEFDLVFDLATVPHMPWPELAEWIPQRVRELVEELHRTIPMEKKGFLYHILGFIDLLIRRLL